MTSNTFAARAQRLQKPDTPALLQNLQFADKPMQQSGIDYVAIDRGNVGAAPSPRRLFTKNRDAKATFFQKF